MTNRQATCSCGQLCITARDEPTRVSVCHCLACQKRTGSTYGAQATFPANQIDIRGQSTEYVQTADSGNQISFYFCPKCGSTVYYRLDESPELIKIPIGAFADPGFPKPTVAVYDVRRHPWVHLPEDIEQYD